jgi:superfamily II DNA/RNA helicase
LEPSHSRAARIFTERLETLRFLQQNLAKDLDIDPKAIAVLHGEGMSDIDQQDLVERFGRLQDPVRILICSDIAAEGINLHFLAHRMVHFDIPWSLMTFQQRNGRIDRYGQERRPQIRYLRTMPATPRVRGDVRVLEVLIRKDQQATENIGDPSAFMGTSNVAEQEEVTADAINRAIDAERFEAELDARRAKAEFDPVAALLGGNSDELAGAAPLTRETMTASSAIGRRFLRMITTISKPRYGVSRTAGKIFSCASKSPRVASRSPRPTTLRSVWPDCRVRRCPAAPR